MPVSAYYQDPTRNYGPDASVALLNGYFSTRKAMNDANRPAQDDPEKIAEHELKAREALGELERVLAQSKSLDSRARSDLLREYLRSKTAVSVAGIKAHGDLETKKLTLAVASRAMADKEAEKLAAQTKTSDPTNESLGKIGVLAKNAAGQHAGQDPGIVGGTMADQVRSLAQTENAGGLGSPKYDAIVRQAYNSIVDAGGVEIADAMAKALGFDEDPNAFFLKTHPTMTAEQADTWTKLQNDARSAGSDPAIVDQWFADLGLSAEDIRGQVEATGGAENDAGLVAPARRGSVSIAGDADSPGMTALTQAASSGADPYAALLAAISAQSKYADDLGAQRKAATIARAKGIYPQANPYTSTPNTYVSDRGIAAIRALGEGDPGRNREMADAGLRHPGRPALAAAEVASFGGDEGRFAPREEYDAASLADGGDFGAWLGTAGPVRVDDPTDPNWGYELGTDGSIKIIKTPAGKLSKHLNKQVKRNSSEWAAIMKVVGDKTPAGSRAAVIAAQPAEVQALMSPVRAALDRGDLKQAAALAKEVSPDAVRAAYGQAMQRAEHDPSVIEQLNAGISALPPEVAGSWGPKFSESLLDYAKTAHTGGSHAAARMRGSSGALGKALGGAAEARDSIATRDATDTAEGKAMASEAALVAHGRDLAQKAWSAASTDEDKARVYDGWNQAHATSPGPLTKGALDAIGHLAAEKPPVKGARLENTTPAPALDDAKVKAGETDLARDWKSQRSEVDADAEHVIPPDFSEAATFAASLKKPAEPDFAEAASFATSRRNVAASE